MLFYFNYNLLSFINTIGTKYIFSISIMNYDKRVNLVTAIPSVIGDDFEQLPEGDRLSRTLQ